MKNGHDPTLLLTLNLLITKLADQCSIVEAADSLELSQHQRMKVNIFLQNLIEDLSASHNDWLQNYVKTEPQLPLLQALKSPPPPQIKTFPSPITSSELSNKGK